jgi:competence protein ComEC
VGGLAGALTAADAGVVMSPVTSYNTSAFNNFLNRVKARNRTLTVPKAGDTFMLGSASVTVLGPLKTNYEDVNDTSIVLRIVYGETSFLFTGDMEYIAEVDLLDSGATLKSTLLKVGHHGSASSTSYRFLREVAPKYGVISVGKDNDYGHPTETVLSRLRDADVTVFRTDERGDIICTSDGKTLTFTTSKGGAVNEGTNDGEQSTEAVTEYAYIGNLNSKKFHHAYCSSLPGEENRIYFTSKAEAEEKGYTACGICKP